MCVCVRTCVRASVSETQKERPIKAVRSQNFSNYQDEGGSKSTSKCEQRDGESPKGTDSAKEVTMNVFSYIVLTVLNTSLENSACC